MKKIAVARRRGGTLLVLVAAAAVAACDDPFDPERVEGVWTSLNVFTATDESTTGSFTLTLVSTGAASNLFGQGTLASLSYSVVDPSIDESGAPFLMTFDFGARGTVSFDGRADSDTSISGLLSGSVRLEAGVDDPRFEFVATPVAFTC